MLALLYSSNTFCMFARAGMSALRAPAVAHTVRTFSKKSVSSRKSRKIPLSALTKKRHALEEACFAHGGLLDLMSLGPDEGIQSQYRRNLLKIEALGELEAELSRKVKK